MRKPGAGLDNCWTQAGASRLGDHWSVRVDRPAVSACVSSAMKKLGLKLPPSFCFSSFALLFHTYWTVDGTFFFFSPRHRTARRCFRLTAAFVQNIRSLPHRVANRFTFCVFHTLCKRTDFSCELKNGTSIAFIFINSLVLTVIFFIWINKFSDVTVTSVLCHGQTSCMNFIAVLIILRLTS